MNMEEFCGIKSYGTSEPGIGGRVKECPEDFRVEEIPLNVGDAGEYLICWLEKKGMTTFDAVSRISSDLGISKREVGYAGLKDSDATTRQLISLRGAEKGDLEKINEENVKVTYFGRSPRPLKPGDLNGNRFLITIRDIEFSPREARGRLKNLREEMGRKGVPNYFGTQRFGGERPVTHLVGRELLRRNFREAVITYLTETFPTEKDDTRKARERLTEDMDFSDALDYFPGYLGYERKLLERLSSNTPERKRDWLKALSVLPDGLRRLFVHSYQSYVFNSSLSELLKSGSVKNFPAKVVGHSTKLSESEFDNTVKDLLKKDGVKPEDFKFKEDPRLSSRGAIRAALIEGTFDIKSIEEGGGNFHSPRATVRFSLNPGSYATVVLREIMKKDG